jgi:hypothetical protein
LVDGFSRRGESQLTGITGNNKRGVFDTCEEFKSGDLVAVKIKNAS